MVDKQSFNREYLVDKPFFEPFGAQTKKWFLKTTGSSCPTTVCASRVSTLISVSWILRRS
jgi:hypothetical protein